MPQAAVHQAGFPRVQCVEDRVSVLFQYSAGRRPERRCDGFWSYSRRLVRADDKKRPPSRGWTRSQPSRQGLHGGQVEVALAGVVRSTCCGHSQRNACQAWPKKGSLVGRRQTPDPRGGGLTAQGLLRPGASPGKNPEQAADVPAGRQTRSIHLWSIDQRLPRATAMQPGGSLNLIHCTSVVQGIVLCFPEH